MGLFKTECAMCGKKMTPFSDPLQYGVKDHGKPTKLTLCAACNQKATGRKMIISGNKITLEEEKEVRLKCNVCGKVFCVSTSDIQNNILMAKQAHSAARIATLETLAGSSITASQQMTRSDQFANRIIDYSKCPNCNSSDISELTDDAFKAEQEKLNTPPNSASLSVADELKKFKELLDMGVISQDEFDAKKKQLLGL